jgi:hypothetical protein
MNDKPLDCVGLEFGTVQVGKHDFRPHGNTFRKVVKTAADLAQIPSDEKPLINIQGLAHLLLCTFRYNLGRRTYFTGICADWLTRYLQLIRGTGSSRSTATSTKRLIAATLAINALLSRGHGYCRFVLPPADPARGCPRPPHSFPSSPHRPEPSIERDPQIRSLGSANAEQRKRVFRLQGPHSQSKKRGEPS